MRRHTNLSANKAIANLHRFSVLKAHGILTLANLDVLELDIADRFLRCTLKHQSSLSHLATFDAVNIKVVYFGKVIVVQSLTCIHAGYIEQVFYLVEHTVVYIDVLNKSSTVWISLYVKTTLAIASIVAI